MSARSRRSHVQDEQEEFQADLKEARRIAQDLIESMPAYLNGIARMRYPNQALIANIFNYKPWPHQWPQGRVHENLSQGHITEYKCKKYLLGVPRIVALWALREGLTVSFGYPNNGTLDDAIWGLPLGMSKRSLHECLILKW